MDQVQFMQFLVQFKEQMTVEMERNRNLTVTEIKESIKDVTDSYRNLKTKVSNLDRENRKRNLIIYGINDEFKDYWELENFVCAFFNLKLQLKVTYADLGFVRRLGKLKEDKARSILVGLTQCRTKLLILKNRPHVEGNKHF